jgi:glycyl-tRNA synthetase beta chain
MSRAPLLLEIGSEEIPARAIEPAATALRDAVVGLLDGAGLAHGEAVWLATPRRLTVHVADVELQQPDREDVLAGPPVKAGPKAAEGFAKGQGLSLDALFEDDTPKGRYFFARKQVQGRPCADLLAEALPGILRNLPFPKRMRWGLEAEPFIRPLHWLVALLGEAVVPCQFAGVTSGGLSRGHRFYADRSVALSADLDAYRRALLDAKVMVDPADRRRVILRGIETLAAEAGGVWNRDEATLDTVVMLVEWPAPLLGQFDPGFLEIPAAVIQTTLRENQKLFTLSGPDGRLLPRFVAVANTLSEASRATVAQGNARVVSARLQDARFFVQEDCKQPLASYLPALSSRIFLAGMGTVRDKVERVVRIAGHLAEHLCPQSADAVERAATLSKCDLATRMVFEFPELQGEVGGEYARRADEPAAVVAAIAQHYQPRFAGDAIPEGSVGACVAMADKLDTIAACFALDLVPTASQDPYALRRLALGVLRILGEGGYPLSLGHVVDLAVRTVLPPARYDAEGAALRDRIVAFCRGRLESLLEADFAPDLVAAVLDAGFDRVANVRPRLTALAELKQRDDFGVLAVAFKRAANLVRKQGQELAEGDAVQPGLFALEAEGQLHAAMAAVRAQVEQAVARGAWQAALAELASLRPTVDQFFDAVMVMTDDAALRRNRLALVRDCAGLFAPIADFARIQA